MNKIERLTNTILLLQERGRTSQELSELMEVSRRTVIRDIEALCVMGVPIIAQGGIGGGYSLAGEYSIAPLQLTWREAMLLMLALSSLSKMSDSPFSDERASLFAKVASLIPTHHREQVNTYLNKVQLEVPERRKAPSLDKLIEIASHGGWAKMIMMRRRETPKSKCGWSGFTRTAASGTQKA
jgi:predicted DNA-binding transcriptional regulator YafY